MRELLLLLFVLLLNFPSFSQKIEHQNDSAAIKKPLSIEISPDICWNNVFARYSAYGGIEFNAILNEKYVLGIQGEILLGEFLKRVVFPNIYEFDHYKFGILTGYQIGLIKNRLSVRPQIKFNLVYAIWQELENKRYYTDDIYFEFRPEINLNYSPVNKLSVFLGMGYNLVSDEQLVGTTQKDLTGENLTLGIRYLIFSR